jgi:hypothetical protein
MDLEERVAGEYVRQPLRSAKCALWSSDLKDSSTHIPERVASRRRLRLGRFR